MFAHDGQEAQTTNSLCHPRCPAVLYNWHMICPFCNQKDSRVLESRLTTENSVRRRRQCETCDKRFTTYERVEVIQLLVVKRSGNREPYTREKLQAGVAR